MFAGQQGEKLPAAVEAAGFAMRPVESLPALDAALRKTSGCVAVVALDCLLPAPEQKLKELRECSPTARLVVVHAPASPRLRLAQRLWSAGALDYLVSEAVRPPELAVILRQALAETERVVPGAGRSGTLDLAAPSDRLRFIHEIGAAMANQQSVAGLLREFHRWLSSMVPYVALQVYLPAGAGFWVRQFQTRPLPHVALNLLLERSAAMLSTSLQREVALDSFSVEEAAPVAVSAASTSATLDMKNARPVVVPMMSVHGLVGCVSLLVHGTAAQAEAARELVETLSFHFAGALTHAQMVKDADRTAVVDAITGCHSLRGFEHVLEMEWSRTVRYHLQLTLVVLEIDGAEKLSKEHGIEVADEAIRRLAALFRAHLRTTDQLACDQGSRFALLLPQTSLAAAVAVIERVRAAFKSPLPNTGGRPLKLSFSAGLAGYPGIKVDTYQGLMLAAEGELARAKRSGGDRTSAVPSAEVAGSVPEEAADARKSVRVPTKLNIRYLEIPDFESGLARASTADISEGGLAIEGPGKPLKKNSFGLVFFEEAPKPALTQVVWSINTPEGQRAGLRLVEAAELDRVAQGDREKKSDLQAFVVTSLGETRAMVSRVLRAAQYEVLLHDLSDAWPDPERLRNMDLVVVGDALLRDGSHAKLRELMASKDRAAVRLVVINESGDRRLALNTLMSHQVRHMVAADDASDEVLFATLNKLLLGEYFGVRKYLLWGAQSKSWTLAHGESKQQVLDGIRALAAEVRCHPRVLDLLVMAVDEMMINALYRAPPEGSPGKPVTVQCGSDGRLLVVSVLDEYGRFAADDLYASLSRSRERESTALSPDAGHAQMGFRIMLDALTQLAINVDPGKVTEVVGIVDLRKSLKEFRSSVPTFNLFSKA